MKTSLYISIAVLPALVSGCGDDGGGNGGDATSSTTEASSTATVGTSSTSNGTSGTSADTTAGTNPTTDTTGGSSTGDPPIQGECGDFSPQRHAYFGELHLHTSNSFDSFIIGNDCYGPAEALDFAKNGSELDLAPFDENCQSIRTELPGTQRLRRTLDFAAVTDHAEFFGELGVCTDPQYSMPLGAGYNQGICQSTRLSADSEDPNAADAGIVAAGLYVNVLTSAMPEHFEMCDNADCAAALSDTWQASIAATEAANESCEFTAFIGYEYSAYPNASMLHRNVIFRGSEVPDAPVSYVEAWTAELLHDQLRADCLNNDAIDCDVLTIAHNSNASAGEMYADTTLVTSAADAQARADIEPLIEIAQAKGNSECISDFTGTDEFCNFESYYETPVCTGQPSDPEGCIPSCITPGNPAECASPYNYVRDILKLGLSVAAQNGGTNPYKLGIVGGTDNHNATSIVEEDQYYGHTGAVESRWDQVLGNDETVNAGDPMMFGPGALSVVWAQENTRASIFDALRNRETYATSGTRPVVRFFGGADMDANMCDSPTFAADGYAAGVPMGGELVGLEGAPSFGVFAAADPDICAPGMPCPDKLTTAAYLERVQIVKGWYTAGGEMRERVYDVACAYGDPVDGRCPEPPSDLLDESTCTPDLTQGAAELCTVWTDPNFEPDEQAFYYVRVLENPTCRWSTYHCNDNGVTCPQPEGSEFEGCCELQPSIQERAWTSPIWAKP